MSVKGVSAKLRTYQDTIPKILDIIKFDQEIAKHQTIILKPTLNTTGNNTKPAFVEAVLKYCLEKKDPLAKVYIAEGSEGADTDELFQQNGFTKLAETYGISLIDLNTATIEEMQNGEFLKFTSIKLPTILKEAFVIALPTAGEHLELEYSGALASMLGCYPSKHYASWFSPLKKKMREYPLKYALHDMLKCKMPDFAIIDASDKGLVFLGNPLEVDKQASKLYKGDWKNVQHLRLVEDAAAYQLKQKIQREREKALKELMPAQLS